MSQHFRNFAKRSELVNILKDWQRLLQKRIRLENPLEIDFKHYFRHNVDRLLLFTQHTNSTNAVVTDPNLKFYQTPTEPDGQKLVAWYKMNDISSNRAKDWSGHNNHATIVGNPIRQAGHVVNMDALSFDGIGNDYLSIPHHSDISMLGLTEGFGISVWVFPTRIDSHGGSPRVIACKIDDDFNTKGRTWSLWVESNGTIVWAVKEGSTVYVRRATECMKVMNIWYHITAFFDIIPNRTTTPIHVNSVEYTADAQTFNDVQPLVATNTSAGIDMLIGGRAIPDVSHWAGAIGDFRYYKDYVYTHANAVTQFSNKYTISDIVHVALAGVATAAYEEAGQVPGSGEPPPPPPPPSTLQTFSAIGFSPYVFNTEKTPDLAGDGGGGAAATIPDQFYDDFSYDPVWSIPTLNDTSPDAKWINRLTVTGTGGIVATQNYTHPGDTIARRVLRLKTSSTPVSPILTINTNRFYDIFMKCYMRIVTQTNNSTTANTLRMIFKYIDNSNYYYVALRSGGAEVVKVISGTPTTLATQSNPSGAILYPIGSIHEVEIETRADGMEILVRVDGSTVISFVQSNYNPPDTVITALTRAGFMAQNCDAVIDHVIMRPVLGDTFQDATYTMNSVGADSPNLKWETAVLGNGTGATIRTFDHSSAATGGRVLNLNSGTGATTQPIVLSSNSYRGLDAKLRMGTVTVHTAAEGNRAQFIFKYVDANNYYWLQLVTTGWRVWRKIAGSDTLVQTGSSPTFSDNPAYPFHLARVQVYNAGREFKLFLGNSETLVYEEHWLNDGMSSDDSGVLAAVGKVGFRAPLCSAVFDNVSVRMI